MLLSDTFGVVIDHNISSKVFVGPNHNKVFQNYGYDLSDLVSWRRTCLHFLHSFRGLQV